MPTPAPPRPDAPPAAALAPEAAPPAFGPPALDAPTPGATAPPPAAPSPAPLAANGAAPLDVAAEPLKKEKKKKKEKEAEDDGDKRFSSKKGVDTMFRTSYRTNMDLSTLADTKANIMISINGLIVSILIASISPKMDANPWLMWPTVALLVGCLLSLVFAVLAARPRVQGEAVTLDQVRQGKANLLFFGNFAHLTRDEFMTGMNELMLQPASAYENMVMDIHGLGQVLQKKYRLLRYSYTLFMLGLIIGVVAFIGVFIYAAQIGQPLGDTAVPIPVAPQGLP